MNFKTPFKVLTTAALVGTLSLSAVVPTNAQAKTVTSSEDSEVAQYQPKEVIFTKEGATPIKMSVAAYAQQLLFNENTELQGYTVQYVITEKGVFNQKALAEELLFGDDENATIETVLEKFDKEGKAVTLPADVKEGKFNDKGELTSEEATDTEDMDVVEIAAINNTVTVGAEYTLPSVVTAKLKNGSTKELAVTWDGTIDTSAPGTQSIKGTVEGTDIKAELTVQVKYANTGVEGFAFLGSTNATLTEKPEAAEGANIFVNGEKQAQTVQSNGSFFLEVNPAAVEVKIKKAGYFAAKVETAVAQNETAAVVAGLKAVTPNTLEINGTVKGATGANLAGATVEIYDETGKTKLAEAITDDKGTYKFGNKGLSYKTDKVGGDTNNTSTSNFLDEEGQPYNVLDIDTKYVLKVSKPLEDSNLDDVYKTYTTSVTTTDEEAITKTQTRVSSDYKVKEIKEATVDLKADTGVTLTDTANVTIYTEEGKTLLSKGEKLATKEDATLATSKADAANKTLDLFQLLKPADAENPTLPTGKYYVLIQDSTNAATVYTMNVTEGTDVKGDTVTIKKALPLSADSTVSDFVYKDSLLKNNKAFGSTSTEDYLAPNDVLTTIAASDVDAESIARLETPVVATYKLYQDVDGVKIPLAVTDEADDAGKYKIADSATKAVASSKLTEYAAKGNKYVITSTSPYTVGTTEGTKEFSGETATQEFSVQSAGTLTPTITFDQDANGRDEDSLALEPADENVIIKLLDKDGKEVAKATKAELAKNEAKANAFTSVRPGEYRLEVSAPGYETATTKADEAVRVLDFQDQEISLELKAKAPTKLSGTITYTNGNPLANIDSNVEASYALYKVNEDKTLSYVTGEDVEVSDENEDASFEVVDKLEVGAKYRLVTRGAGFETNVKEFTATEGLNTADIKVTKGGNASATLTIVDTKKNKFTEDPHAYVLDPEYLKEFGFYDENDNAITGTPKVEGDDLNDLPTKEITIGTGDDATTETVVLSDANEDGIVTTEEQNAFLDLVTNGKVIVAGTSSDLTYNGVSDLAQQTDEKMFVATGLSKGEHTVVIPSARTASGVDSIRYNEKSLKINYVGQKLVSAVTVGIPTVQDGQVTYSVAGTVSNAGTDPVDTVLVAAYQGDKLVDYVAANSTGGSYNYELQLPNGKYTLKAYSNGELVGALENVAIQDNHVTGKNIALSTAK